jgi:hypothetical protein
MTRSIRYTSQLRLFGWPLVAAAWGSDFSRNEARGHARGIIAVGDVVTVAGVGFGALVIAGVAIAQTAFGGVAIGHYAKGGAAIGCHVVSAARVDHSAAVWFDRLSLHQSEASQPTEPPVKNRAE